MPRPPALFGLTLQLAWLPACYEGPLDQDDDSAGAETSIDTETDATGHGSAATTPPGESTGPFDGSSSTWTMPGPDTDGPGQGPAPTGEHFYVDGSTLRDPCGEPVVLRGVNHMMVYADRECHYCNDIAQTGANAVRMMWVTEVDLSEAETAVNRAVELGMLPMLEIQNSTCDFGSVLDSAVAFWLRPDSIEFIRRHEAHLLINVANEPGDASDSRFRDYFAQAVVTLRDAGIRPPLVLDASGCGRNVEQLLAVAPELLEADPDHNLVFSWHIYDSGPDQPGRIHRSLQTAADADIPLIIGEFSAVGMPFCDPVPYQAVIAEAEDFDVGYLPWSWTPGNQDCEAAGGSVMDMTATNAFSSLRGGWATEVAISDPNSIRNTSVPSRFLSAGGCE